MKNIRKITVASLLTLAAIIFVLKNKYFENDSQPTQEIAATNLNTELINTIKNHTPLKYALIKNAKVIKLLADDKQEALYQRWIMEIENGLTITVFHNVNIAERLPLNEGSFLTAAGELTYDNKTNLPILQWTHDDPQGVHKSGYIIFNGETYGHATGP